MKRYGVGIIGCGNICGIYFDNCSKFENLRLVACSDAVPERAAAKATQYGVSARSVEEILADPEIDIVLNLTTPGAHAELNLRALSAGKHVYCEKPLGINRIEGKRILDTARNQGLLVGCAPDTFLGAGLQTCRKVIDSGRIGRPVAATAFMMCHGHEGWHPDPEFYYQPGGGPMLDMGPYYVTALVTLIGPVRQVAGMTATPFATRTIGSEKKRGTTFPVEVPTHIAGLLRFDGGAVGTIITSFDVWSANVPLIEIHGTEGSMSVPDPNMFGGTVRVFNPGHEWEEIPLAHRYSENSRGLGVAEMADAIEEGRRARASGDLAYHVLDIMEGLHDSSDRREHLDLSSGVDRPAPMPESWAPAMSVHS